MKNQLFLFVSLFVLVACQPKDPIEKQIDDLLSQMTLEEKIAQMNQLSGGYYSEDLESAVRAGLGSMLNSVGEETNYYQRIAVEESRLGIPMLLPVMSIMGIVLSTRFHWGRQLRLIWH